jgi:hypothetical protein
MVHMSREIEIVVIYQNFEHVVVCTVHSAQQTTAPPNLHCVVYMFTRTYSQTPLLLATLHHACLGRLPRHTHQIDAISIALPVGQIMAQVSPVH